MKPSNDRFKSYVRSTAFSVSMSYNQIQSLFALVEGDIAEFVRNGNIVTGFKGCIARGLVEHHEYPDRADKRDEYTGMTTGKFPAYTITQAGQKMYELLKIAGF